MKRLLLAAAVIASLAACQREPAPATDAAAAAPAPAATPTEAAAPAPASTPVNDFAGRIDGILAAEHRSAENKARDDWRHPKETLAFFGIEPGMTVVEMNPGGGWYTEILGPLLAGSGQLITAVVDPAKTSSDRAREYNEKANADLRAKFAANAAVFGAAQVVEYDPQAPVLGAPGSADMVVTFRNLHGWTRGGTAPAMFKGFFDVLKPGGVLGIEQHRANPGTASAEMAGNGYLTEEEVIAMATAAGFELAGQSEINANPNDTKDHANGVWSLPPNLDGHDTEESKARAQKIGESDRMTLRFVKPAVAATTATPSATPAG
jgi:predicted methyltransferase